MSHFSDDEPSLEKVGYVVIGRNEGKRLEACLRSIRTLHPSASIVYVDSGSDDHSVAFAQSLSVLTVELDMTTPFTAARARNEGWQALIQAESGIEFVQFMDGDCQLCKPWVPSALNFLLENPTVAVACGRRKELYPERSIYNLFCDLEWNTPIGRAKSCGGDALIRVSALLDVHGYRSDVIAGEEPEMCVRLRQSGWEVFRIDEDMTLHDANMLKMRQWWKRARRCGFAYALGAAIHGAAPERHWVKETARSCIWGAVIPVIAILAAFLFRSFLPLVCLFALYALQTYRMSKQVALPNRERFLWALHGQLSKFAEFQGVMEFVHKRIRGKAFTIIEYK